MQRSVAVTVTSVMKNPPKKLNFLQFSPRFQALSLLFLRNSYLLKRDNNIQKYCPTTCFSRFIEVTVIRDADKANQDKIVKYKYICSEFTHLVENFDICVFPAQPDRKLSSQNYGRRTNQQSSNHKNTNYADSRYCRHRRQLLCFECHMCGHKDSVCWNNMPHIMLLTLMEHIFHRINLDH